MCTVHALWWKCACPRLGLCVQGQTELVLPTLSEVCVARPLDPMVRMDVAMANWKSSHTWEAMVHWQAAVSGVCAPASPHCCAF